ncbi:MAG: erythromycin esterase family protein [Myxococcales bacterium]|nr:erythromycin esterase family protein [Myxococcales bacterium]
MVYEDGTPAAGAVLGFTTLSSGAQVAVVKADDRGGFRAPLPPDVYALTATTSRGHSWVERRALSGNENTIRMLENCHVTAGRVTSAVPGVADVHLEREGAGTGERYVTYADKNGDFRFCLPAGVYTASVSGELLAPESGVVIPSKIDIRLPSYPTEKIRSAPEPVERVSHGIEILIRDIEQHEPKVVGLGEATHGSAEFVSARAALTFALARQSGLQTILLENDAIVAMEIDRYVNGEDVNIAKVATDLGFWTTDTYEFLQFLGQVRTYNQKLPPMSPARLRIWGVDAQETAPPVELLVAHAAELRLSEQEIALLHSLVAKRGAIVKGFDGGQRASLDQLLSRLAVPRGESLRDTQLVVAATSLAIQVGYLDGDVQGLYNARRDAGMAKLAQLIVSATGTKRACFWAHNDHVARVSQVGYQSIGQLLATAFPGRYYPVGFYLFKGSARAWDAEEKIGVISHRFKPAPAFTVEGALMNATRFPDIAWVPFGPLPPTLRSWFKLPRYARELGATSNGEARTMILFDMPSAFEAAVVIKYVHDSSPTPTGIRKASGP